MKFGTIIMFCLAFKICHSQRQWSFDLYYPLIQRFDLDPKIQNNVKPTLFEVQRRALFTDGAGSAIDTVWRIPYAFAASIIRMGKKRAISIDWLVNYTSSVGRPVYEEKQGLTRGIEYSRLSFLAYEPLVVLKRDLFLLIKYGASFRKGRDFYKAPYIPSTYHYPYRTLLDFGVETGARVQWVPTKRVGFFFDAGLRQWLFLFSHTFEKEPLKGPRSELEFKLGLSFLFGKEVDMVKPKNKKP